MFATLSALNSTQFENLLDAVVLAIRLPFYAESSFRYRHQVQRGLQQAHRQSDFKIIFFTLSMVCRAILWSICLPCVYILVVDDDVFVTRKAKSNAELAPYLLALLTVSVCVPISRPVRRWHGRHQRTAKSTLVNKNKKSRGACENSRISGPRSGVKKRNRIDDWHPRRRWLTDRIQCHWTARRFSIMWFLVVDVAMVDGHKKEEKTTVHKNGEPEQTGDIALGPSWGVVCHAYDISSHIIPDIASVNSVTSKFDIKAQRILFLHVGVERKRTIQCKFSSRWFVFPSFNAKSLPIFVGSPKPNVSCGMVW